MKVYCRRAHWREQVIRVLFFLVFLPAFRAGAEEFVWQFEKGDRFRIIGTVSEDIHINGVFSHHAEMLNRATAVVEDVEGARALLHAEYSTGEEIRREGGEGDAVFSMSREYPSEYWQDSRGRMTIGREYFMPVVRDVPVFPEGDIAVGQTWTAPGHEVHDFRESFGMGTPWRIPFTAQYRYLGPREWNGKMYPAISVHYEINESRFPARGRIQPVRIEGSSDQMLYWDSEAGHVRHYTETFRFGLELSNGYMEEFSGTAEAELVESSMMDRQQLADAIREDVRSMGIEGAEVEARDDGVAIVLEDIQFQADSSRLLPSEREKLNRIAEILARYRERDILVEGHTALAGSAQGRERLSLERAGAVAEYLVGRGARTRDRVLVRGHGAARPRASNSTEEGRRRNRRVEITILEN